MADSKKDVAAFQLGKAKLEIHEDVDHRKLVSLVGDRIPLFAERLRAAEERRERILGEVIPNPDLFAEYVNLQGAQAQVDIMLNRDLDQMAVEDKVAKVDRLHRYMTLGSCILFEHVNCSGAAKWMSTTVPNFVGWPYYFNDKGSSLIAWGLNILFEHTWFGGRRFYFFGSPWTSFRLNNLSAVGFNDTASSYMPL